MDVFLMADRDFEKEVIDYLMERYPIREHWFKPGYKKITKDWTLNDDFRLVPEDAEDMLLDVFTHFNIDYSGMDTRNYIEYEYPFWQKKPETEIKPLTVAMIIESAKVGRWLYD